DRELEPFAGAVVVEPCRIEPAVIERGRALVAQRFPAPIRHELVDVLELLVVAHVADDAVVAPDRDRAAFVSEAPERRALDRGRGRRHRIDLDDPPEPIALVDVVRIRQIEARVEPAPAVKRCPAGVQAVALLPRARLETLAPEV